MATSSGDDVPWGHELRFSRNYLKVAIAMARALAVLVALPRLLQVRFGAREGMRIVNGVSGFVEAAEGKGG